MPVALGKMLWEERKYSNPIWTLIDYVVMFMTNGKAKVIPERHKKLPTIPRSHEHMTAVEKAIKDAGPEAWAMYEKSKK